MTTDKWITDRPPTEDDVDIKDCIFVPEYRPGIQSKTQSVTLDQYFSIFKDGHPWRRTKRERKHKSNPKAQSQLCIPVVQLCSSCRFFDPLYGARQGICRRYAPKPTTGDKEHSSAFWPEVVDCSWCGEWEIKP